MDHGSKLIWLLTLIQIRIEVKCWIRNRIHTETKEDLTRRLQGKKITEIDPKPNLVRILFNFFKWSGGWIHRNGRDRIEQTWATN
jgi:hypothetical protein